MAWCITLHCGWSSSKNNNHRVELEIIECNTCEFVSRLSDHRLIIKSRLVAYERCGDILVCLNSRTMHKAHSHKLLFCLATKRWWWCDHGWRSREQQPTWKRRVRLRKWDRFKVTLPFDYSGLFSTMYVAAGSPLKTLCAKQSIIEDVLFTVRRTTSTGVRWNQKCMRVGWGVLYGTDRALEMGYR